ncbi:MAG TPA: hypothetical protein VLG50_02825 [Candidatus Saccharimonadales bacterium]|nr:hypothetical protein [Candidatus Saccharimonadales bacterium]
MKKNILYIIGLLALTSMSYSMIRRTVSTTMPRMTQTIPTVARASASTRKSSSSESAFSQAVEKWQKSVPPQQQQLAQELAERLKNLEYSLTNTNGDNRRPVTPEELSERLQVAKEIFQQMPDLSGINKKLLLKEFAAEQKAVLKASSELSPEYLTLQHIINTIAPVGQRPSISTPEGEKKRAAAQYKRDTESIELGPVFRFDAPPSVKFHTIMHEYRHHLQQLARIPKSNKDIDPKIDPKFYPQAVKNAAQEQQRNNDWFITEQDAEHFATQHCTCPTCLKVCQKWIRPKNEPIRQTHGYFTRKNYDPFIEAAQNNARCPAHTLTPGDEQHNAIVQELEAALNKITTVSPTDSPKEYNTLDARIIQLDKKSGTLLQHIPKYHENLLRSFMEHQQFYQGLALSTAQKMEAAQAQKEEPVKLLPAPKQSMRTKEKRFLQQQKAQLAAERKGQKRGEIIEARL